jgi:hypothetical protein
VVDAEKVIRAYLATDDALNRLVGERIHAGTHLPPGYKPMDGPAILFAVRGGSQHYSNAVLQISAQYQCFAATDALAREVARALYDALNDQAAQGIKQSRLEAPGQLLADPETGWHFVFSAFRHWLVNT